MTTTHGVPLERDGNIYSTTFVPQPGDSIQWFNGDDPIPGATGPRHASEATETHDTSGYGARARAMSTRG